MSGRNEVPLLNVHPAQEQSLELLRNTDPIGVHRIRFDEHERIGGRRRCDTTVWAHGQVKQCLLITQQAKGRGRHWDAISVNIVCADEVHPSFI